MKLRETLRDIRDAFEASDTPAEDIRVLDEHVAHLGASGAAARVLPEGSLAPELALPSTSGTTVRLSDLRASGPAVLVWFRGNW